MFFPFLLVYEYNNDRWVFFSRQKISKWFTCGLLTKIALGLYDKSKDVDKYMCVLRAVASCTLILG